MEMSDMAPALRDRLGSEASAGLLALFTIARQEWTAEMTSAAVERFDRRLSDELSELRKEFRADLTGVRDGLRTEIANLRDQLRAEIGGVRDELRAEIGSVRDELRTEIGGLRGEIREELREIRRDIANLHQEHLTSRFTLVKWCFVFWVGQAVAVAGILGVMLRLTQT